MDTQNLLKQELEENLSEEILSEDAIICPVKIFRRLEVNMKMTSFHPSKFKKIGFNSCKNIRSSDNLRDKPKGTKTRKMYQKNKYKSFFENKELFISEEFLSKTQEDSKYHNKILLKDNTSNLLYKPPRGQKSAFANHKVIEGDLKSESDENRKEE
ncbi:unnamed protein product [Moneuplotes crassus]|uniref:Uncharacterized protein n=1 Tax=Euplotes crassus TaxID=5936 RepID=A0AAD1U222_EUPCR|nr:unnamed protein product [Moneuplotes crassus]